MKARYGVSFTSVNSYLCSVSVSLLDRVVKAPDFIEVWWHIWPVIRLMAMSIRHQALTQTTQIARHVGPTLAQRGADRIHVGPTWGQRSFLSGYSIFCQWTPRIKPKWSLIQNESSSFMNMHFSHPQNVDNIFWPPYVNSRDQVPLH